MRTVLIVVVLFNIVNPYGAATFAQDRGRPWKRHTIDNTSRGADGVRLADANGDGLLDIATAWEEGGKIRVYLNPGPKQARHPWPQVTVGQVASPEDAVLVDLDHDGMMDVVSCCEGKNRSVFVHWAPKNKADFLKAEQWKTEAVPAVKDVAAWMFCLPMQVDGKNGLDLVIGAKNAGAAIGWLEAPANPRRLEQWRWHAWYQAGWVMSLVAADIDGDGDKDIVASDRRGPNRGCLWLENPGRPESKWKVHRIGPIGQEVMFLDVADLNRDGRQDVLVAVRPREIVCFFAQEKTPQQWKRQTIPFPRMTGTAKSVRAADLNLDGKLDLVFSCENAKGASGLLWLSFAKSVTHSGWQAHEISGPEGVKFDIVQLIDLDADGDLDVITTEEREGLGVIWYENPTR
ncbi:MAG: hypothetical protein KatS3mg105_2163 [Gemmatales bacterium]|nr:MAG: hypothetical protein KatS3mg105_2163 [Gemmatales bacterium]